MKIKFVKWENKWETFPYEGTTQSDLYLIGINVDSHHKFTES